MSRISCPQCGSQDVRSSVPGTLECHTCMTEFAAPDDSDDLDLPPVDGDDEEPDYDGSDEFDESMDGDAESALASVGWGTDE